MKIDFVQRAARTRRGGAFTLVEVSVSVAIIGIIVLAIYGALSSGISTIRMARENLRATQILLEKTEGFRLYTWDQLTTPGFVPTNFTVPYDAFATNGAGVLYQGAITIGPYTNAPSYAPDLRIVTITVRWQTGQMPRTRTMQTYVAKNGIQNYIY
jgi:prepilin-type N-terminal cleavage/methylation domain-containing protein